MTSIHCKVQLIKTLCSNKPRCLSSPISSKVHYRLWHIDCSLSRSAVQLRRSHILTHRLCRTTHSRPFVPKGHNYPSTSGHWRSRQRLRVPTFSPPTDQCWLCTAASHTHTHTSQSGGHQPGVDWCLTDSSTPHWSSGLDLAWSTCQVFCLPPLVTTGLVVRRYRVQQGSHQKMKSTTDASIALMRCKHSTVGKVTLCTSSQLVNSLKVSVLRYTCVCVCEKKICSKNVINFNWSVRQGKVTLVWKDV